ncbi:hypothetical protein BST95_18195 [Halioglobus japonicus]|uniref:Big-1 domain-containing protein n=1 Tax=Halioglobus japonicus TaxID=930805 RepID=A0AAP8SP04_9GAMM|nr:Ig-like domain-containing protein [Halioglobus japonicus]AQA19893.1 hypothetical protein BST95_18195 [Halioglobus japonicus]PLW87031.1 hypothetical protein C0029_00030 [Halioglobus japonicus]GHD10579.1 hypothetical protein GCM10007052_10000 [Halioglobus japonicus]
MITRFASLSSRLAATLIALFAITACGGGGGGGGGGFLGDSGGSSDTYFIQVVLKDSDGNETSTVSTNSPGTLQVLVTQNGPNGNPIADVIVTASTSSGLLFPSSGSKLTNADGVVTFRIESGPTDRGAGTIDISVDDPSGTTVTASVNFQLGIDGLRLGHLIDGVFFESEIGIEPGGAIPAQGTAILSLAIVDENDQPVGGAESVSITSSCIATGASVLSAENPVPVVDGIVQVDYTVVSCAGVDQLTAELVGDGLQAFGIVEIAAPSADALTFISADPTLIVLKGTGGGPDRKEQSKVTFEALDSLGNPQAGVEVTFSLSTDVGGVTIAPSSAFTDEAGLVSTNVNSGDVATVVRVIATMDTGDGSGEISAISDVLTISTGLPDQNSISLSVSETFVVEEGMTKDGVPRCLTVRMADKFNNPVPNGTAAVFTTEYGSIDPSCETGRSNGDRAGLAGCEAPVPGRCSVGWISQAPRQPTLEENQALVVRHDQPYPSGYNCPSHNGTSGPCPDDLGMIRGGRSTILVTAIGEESFIDRNGNGVFDQEEADDGLWANLTEAFLDHNEDGNGKLGRNRYDPATIDCLDSPNSLTCKAGSEEIFVDFNSNGRFDANGDDPANGYPDEGLTAVYNGLLCPQEGDGVWCSRELLNVRASLVLVLSTDPNWTMALYDQDGNLASMTTEGNQYVAYVSDLFNNKPTGGSTVTVEGTGPCTATLLGNESVPNTTSYGAFPIRFSQGGEVEYDGCTESAPSGSELEGEIKITLDPFESEGGPYTQTWACSATPVNVGPTPCPDEGGGDGGDGGGDDGLSNGG